MGRKKGCCGASPRCKKCPKRKEAGKKGLAAVDRDNRVILLARPASAR
ncbi:hypothetical protein [Azonexus sp. R2A61]|nr:hypothetical protein [Azonexus sp. R2A61]